MEKENISKLGMRSLERRLMRVEEAAFHTAKNMQDIRNLLLSSLLPAESNENLLGVPDTRLKSASDGALNRDHWLDEREVTGRRRKVRSGGSYPPMGQKENVFDLRGQSEKRPELPRRDMEFMRDVPEENVEKISPRSGRRKLVSTMAFDEGSLEYKTGYSSKNTTADSEKAMHVDSHSADSGGESDIPPTTPDKEDGLKDFGSHTRLVPKVVLEPGRVDMKRTHSHQVLRLSTFERYLSMVAPQQEFENHRPIKRQVGGETPKFKDNSRQADRHLATAGMRHIDSESNISVYSTTSQTHNVATMQRPMPYTSAPPYSTITDHIDLSQINNNRLRELGASTSSTGYISMNDNLDIEMPASPAPFNRPGVPMDFTPFTRLRSDTSLCSPTRPATLRKVEQGCYEMMDDSESDPDQTRTRTDIEDEDESGIEFNVRKSTSGSQESKEENTKETVC